MCTLNPALLPTRPNFVLMRPQNENNLVSCIHNKYNVKMQKGKKLKRRMKKQTYSDKV